METTRKRREKKEKYWEKTKSNKNKDQKKTTPAKKSKNTKPKVKLIIPSRGKKETSNLRQQARTLTDGPPILKLEAAN